jgi:drug/metabolite transporter (DMT)-like permease
MEIGLIFALLSAVALALTTVFLRRGTFRTGESFTAVIISIFIGTIFSLCLVLFTADWDKLWSLSWQGFALLGTAGIIHFVLGRLLGYSCIRLIGANRGIIILRTQILYAVIFGILLLNESLTTFLVLGVLCLAGGVTLVSVEKGGKVTKIDGRGILAGLGGAFFWGISGVLIKPAVEEIGSPYPAVFISYTAASVAIAGLLLRQEQRQQLIQLHRQSITPLVLTGIFATIAQLFRYAALSYSPVSVVTPLIGINVLFTFFLSFLLNRNIEVFSWKVFIGIVVTVVGAFLLFQ